MRQTATFITLITIGTYSCSHTSSKPADPLPQPRAAPQVIESFTEAEQFDAALNAMKKGAFKDAVFLWKDYVANFAAFPNYNPALVHYARSLHQTGETGMAIEAIKPLVESENVTENIDVQMLYAEFLVADKRVDEAVALTFDMLPDLSMQKKLGIKTRGSKLHPGQPLGQSQKIKILTLRGWLYAELGKENDAYKSLARARLNLTRYKAAKQEKRALTALVGLRMIQMLGAACKTRSHLPDKLSEAEFVEFSEKYYKCADPARIYICEIRAIEDPVFYADGVSAYKNMVFYPLKLMSLLSRPARLVKDSQKTAYEAEMKTLIESTVAARVKHFKDIEGCDAFDIF